MVQEVSLQAYFVDHLFKKQKNPLALSSIPTIMKATADASGKSPRRCAKTLSDSESRPSLSSFFRQFPSINSSGQLTPPPRDSINCSSSLSGLSFLKHLPLRLFGRFCGCLWSLLYATFQTLIIFLFAPNPEWITPQPSSDPRGRIAIVGAGITGISSAAHFLAHGFEVVIFEQSETIGGIWARVNRSVCSIPSSISYCQVLPSLGVSYTFPGKKREGYLQVACYQNGLFTAHIYLMQPCSSSQVLILSSPLLLPQVGECLLEH